MAPPYQPAPRSAWPFLLLVFAATWTLWSLAAVLGPRLPHGSATAAIMGGTLLVPLAALLLLPRGARSALPLWRAALADLRRLTPAGLALALLLMPALAAVAALVAGAAAGRPLQAGPVLDMDGGLAPYLKTFGFGLLLGPVLEELGWRGYALEPLQARYGALGGTVLLALVHALWHVPLFFIAGSFQYKLGFLSVDFWRFMADVAVFDVLVAGLFNAQRRSIAAAALFHATFNVAGGLFLLSAPAAWLRDGLAAGLALALVVATRGRLFRPADRA